LSGLKGSDGCGWVNSSGSFDSALRAPLRMTAKTDNGKSNNNRQQQQTTTTDNNNRQQQQTTTTDNNNRQQQQTTTTADPFGDDNKKDNTTTKVRPWRSGGSVRGRRFRGWL
jgi:hypothetical protein